ncbi:diguanylate cyclase domain-containing protein [Vibrio campbellii]|uniref:diguanylate cyclase domain-containing protein n=1 Tax=Vibrio campbellii TaxID=680 RepID=UPI000CD33910|nr:diguanylate cyclase [Vibrio campbellii]AUV86441.1 GGDEF domain-containing protein [Vibrio campbellii]
MISLRSILTLIVVAGSLLPAYWVGISMIDKHQADLLVQKEIKLENTNQGIQKTISEDLTFIANLTRWYSKDRLLVQGMDNVLYSSVIWQMIETFEGLATNVSTTYIIDKNWQPMYESNGSVYHLENSRLLTKIRAADTLYKQGKMYHTTYFDEGLVYKGGQSGIAIVSPLLPYTLLPGSEYEPQGYLVVLVSYQDLIQISQPFLYKQESVNFHYGDVSLTKGDDSKFVSDIVVTNRNFVEPLEITMIHSVSNAARDQELMQSKQQLLNIIVATLVVTLVIAILASRWLTLPIREMTMVVRSFKNNKRPDLTPKRFQFKEFRQLMNLLDSLWVQLTNHMDELEIRNQALRKANQQVQDTNAQLANFNQVLEHRVEEQTAELRVNLTREEAHKAKLMTLINFTTSHAGVGYHAIPEVINSGLNRLLPQSDMRFSFTKPKGERVKTMRSSTGTVVGYFDYGTYALDEEERILLELFKKQLYSWLELEDFARRDKLSKCLNRKAFDDDYEFARQSVAKGYWDSMAVIIIDINGLKTLNDNYGHDRGDLLISKSTQLIKSVLRDELMLYRIGGDEFAIIAPEQSQQSLEALISSLEEAQEDKWMDLSEHKRHPLKFSVGGASSDNVSLDNLFSMADEAMYEKKRAFYQLSGNE